MNEALMRFHGLVRKEALQITRDVSALFIAFLLPFVLLIFAGFSVSLDARKLPVAVVTEAPAEASRGLFQAMTASPYLTARPANSVAEAEQQLLAGHVRGILVLPEDFLRRLNRVELWPVKAQIILNGTDPNTARLLEVYVGGALQSWIEILAGARRLKMDVGVDLEHRYWFNPELRSADSIVPGAIAFVMSMTGTLLTALIVAREWERGTMEALLASPATMAEIILAKLGCYFVLGMGSMTICVFMAIFIFGVPFRGSVLALIAATSLFLIFALAFGLFISTLARNQFVAAQIAFLTTMMPALMLSGMLFDIATMPRWLQIATYGVPARYLVSILQSLFLAGTIWPIILPNLAALGLAASIAVAATFSVTRRRLD